MTAPAVPTTPKPGDLVVAGAGDSQVKGKVSTVASDGTLTVVPNGQAVGAAIAVPPCWSVTVISPPAPIPTWAANVGAVGLDARLVAWQYIGGTWRSVRAEQVGGYTDLLTYYGPIRPLA